ncbi:LysR substrate-binding domain-containing protein [Pseudomonas sp. G2-4]|uniref:LysR substrate-binding domain-containing protein n=1 Tax=Pseudomonas sp. G2-4 TaxID=1506334 RepID=UPI0024BB9977|nr:LysR substrate-binding domain-containing protein [Pseudomonas sp. G2-4]WHS63200.1 LysR substrate-binding domain-containing protein [Pseudomonas sp. G2-4]
MNTLGKSLPPLASLLPFEAAARLESFSKAAEELHITQAAVSRQIRGLEEDLGLKLFCRRNRAVFLTQEGRELGRVVSTALQSISDSAVTLRQSPAKNRVVLLCQLCEAFYWPRLSTFHQRYPEIEIQVATSTRPLTEFREHFDVALQSTGRPSGAHILAFTAADEVFPVCSPHYLRTPKRLPVSALQSHTLLHYRATPPHWMQWDGWLQAFGQPLDGASQGRVFDSYPLMLQAAVEGHGIALGWERTAARLIESGALVRPCAESVPLPDAISVFRRPGGEGRVEVSALIDWLENELRVDS